MMGAFWNWFVIILTVASILGCWWLLLWTKGISGRDDDQVGTTGHTWDEDLVELNSPLPSWWLYLFHITIVFSIIYIVLYPGLGNVKGILGWTQLNQYEEVMSNADAAQQEMFARILAMKPEQLVKDDEALETGRRLFANNCSMCHGSDGRGAPSFPDLTDASWLYGDSYDQVLTSITKGRQGVMPPLGAALGEDGVAETAAYVQQLSGQDINAGLASAGKTRYDMLCMACHGVDGKGNQALGAPDLTNGIWLYGGSSEAITRTITEGRNGNMPAHENLLTEVRRRLVAAYVVSLSRQ